MPCFDVSGLSRFQMLRRDLVYVILVLISVCLSLWFWINGIYKSNSDQCMEPRAFFFANLSAYGNIRIIFVLIGILTLGMIIDVMFQHILRTICIALIKVLFVITVGVSYAMYKKYCHV